MVGLKKFCLIIASLAIAASVCILLLPWINMAPYNDQVAVLLTFSPWFFYGVEVLAAIALFSALCLFVAGVAMHKPHDFAYSTRKGSHIAISRAAIASQVTYLAEQTADVVVDKVHVSHDKAGGVSVTLELQPNRSISIKQASERIESAVQAGLQQMLDIDRLTISLRFVEATQASELLEQGTPASSEGPDITVDMEAPTAK